MAEKELSKSKLKAVVLAAGKASIRPGRPLILEDLGGQSILQCVLSNALEFVAPEDLYVVVNGKADLRNLDPAPHYVEQKSPAGTADAVLQLVKESTATRGRC